MGGQHRQQQHPPPTRWCDEQRSEQDGVRWPQNCQRKRRESECKADFRADEVQESDDERKEDWAVKLLMVSRYKAARLAFAYTEQWKRVRLVGRRSPVAVPHARSRPMPRVNSAGATNDDGS